jgi:serine/threonine protein kinase
VIVMDMQGYTTGEALLRMGPFIVRRGRRTHDDHAVLLKVPARVSPRRTEVEALAHEGALLRGLSLAGVPPVLDFVHDPPCLVLDDVGLSPLGAVGAARAGDLTWFFAVAIELTAILSRLHHAHLVCGGVAPAAMLASADGRLVQLLDHSLAAKAALDPTITSSVTWGMTPYTSPEQTGRINRGIDHRSDLYSLGMTLYELLTGAPPFRSDDSLELVHAHLARMPLAPHIIAGGVPEQVSAIVMRLVAKAAEDRYQSARGVKADLEICARQWSASRTIAPFELAAHDVSERFLIPQRLYGRDRELAELVAAFDGKCEGRAALRVVSGY